MTYFLGSNSSDSFEIFPEYDYRKSKMQIKTKALLANGNANIYKYGEYDYIKLRLSDISSSHKERINTYWEDGEQLILWVSSGGISSVSSIMLINKTLPIKQFSYPYWNLHEGELILGGY